MEYNLFILHVDENTKKTSYFQKHEDSFFWNCYAFFWIILLEEQIPISTSEVPLKVCFSPQGNCEDLVIDTIASAEKSIKVQAYSFTSLPITTALIRAHKRGVSVQVICDKSQTKARHSKIKQLQQANIPVYIDKVSGLSHNKVMIIDDQSAITGSYNWSHAANVRNAENLLLIHSPALANKYNENWSFRLQGAQIYLG
jgi:phospholipase D